MGPGTGKHVRMTGPQSKGRVLLSRTQRRSARSWTKQGSCLNAKKTKPAGQGPAGSEPETGNVCDGSTSQH